MELDGTRFASSDASFSSYSYGNIYRWEGTGLSLRDGDTVEVRLHRAFEDETAVNSPAIGQPTISGTVQVGETLTADTSGIEDADGLDNAAFTYRWLADNAAIAGATGSTYTLADAGEGKAITVQVSFTDDAGNDETLTSAATDAVLEAGAADTPATGAPTVSGTAQVGETLTAGTSGIVDADGLTNATFNYQWLADDADIAGATGSTYTLVEADEGKAIKVRVFFTDDAGNEEELTSGATDAVAAPEPPAKPTGLSATPSHDRVVLTWDDPNDDTITGYVILRRNRETDAQGQFTELAPDTGTAATTYTDDTVAAETPYTYRIKAINAHGTSERSRWFHIDTLAGPEPTQEPTPEPESVSEGDADLPNDNSTPGRVAVGGSATGAIGTDGDQDRFAVELVAGRTYQFDLTGSPGGGGRDASGHLFPGDLQQRGTVPGGQLQRRLRRRSGQPGDVHGNGERDVLRAGVGRPGRGRELHAERDRRDATVTGDGIALEVGVARPITTTSPARPAPWSSPGWASRGNRKSPHIWTDG